MAEVPAQSITPSRPATIMTRRLLARLAARFKTRTTRIDPELLTEHIKRDLGFLDGPDRRIYEKPWLR